MVGAPAGPGTKPVLHVPVQGAPCDVALQLLAGHLLLAGG